MSAWIDSRGESAFYYINELLSFQSLCPSEACRQLRARFMHPVALYSAGFDLLQSCGLGRNEALLLSQIPSLVRCCEMSVYGRQQLLDNCVRASAYLRAHYISLTVERFYLLCLDPHGRLTGLTMVQEGTENGAIFSLRALMRKVQHLNPHAVVLSHNHPGGNLHPSEEDIQCTRAAICALATIGVPVLDHLILTRSEALSLRRNGFIPEHLWLEQAPDSRLMKNWLACEDA